MLSQLHPALRALSLAFGGLLVVVLGSYAAYSGLRALAQSGMPAPPRLAVAAPSAGQTAGQNYMADPATASKRVSLLVKQSHGDWNRLSDTDQKMLNGMTAGHGREMLQGLAKQETATARRHPKQ
jgi:hypothetical protein